MNKDFQGISTLCFGYLLSRRAGFRCEGAEEDVGVGP
jgi:hypothetical protein